MPGRESSSHGVLRSTRLAMQGRYVLASLTAWCVIGLLCAGELVVYGDPVWPAIEFAALTFLPAAALSFPVWVLANRRPWSRLPAPAAIAAHLATALAFSVVVVSLEVGAATALHAAVRPFLVGSMGAGALVATAVYGLIVGVSMTIRSGIALEAERAEVSAQRAAVAEAQSALATADLAMMRGMLNPHFLFNALHSIAALVRVDPAEADNALDELGHMLRATTSPDPGDVARLDDEVELAKAYLRFERRRLAERLTVSFDVDDEAGECFVPRLLLQPLVDNAIRHGVDPLTRKVSMAVRARIRTGRLEIDVDDDGAGSAAVDWTSRGIGLVTLRRRLRALYGDGASLEVTTALGAGFRVHVRVPAV